MKYLKQDFESIRNRIAKLESISIMDKEEYLMFCYLGTDLQELYIERYIHDLMSKIYTWSYSINEYSRI